MKNLFTTKLFFKKIRPAWKTVLSVSAGLLLIGTDALAQKKPAVYGKGGTVPIGAAGFEVDGNFNSADRPGFVRASFYSPSAAPAAFIPYINDVDGEDWVGANGVLKKV